MQHKIIFTIDSKEGAVGISIPQPPSHRMNSLFLVMGNIFDKLSKGELPLSTFKVDLENYIHYFIELYYPKQIEAKKKEVEAIFDICIQDINSIVYRADGECLQLMEWLRDESEEVKNEVKSYLLFFSLVYHYAKHMIETPEFKNNYTLLEDMELKKFFMSFLSPKTSTKKEKKS